MNAWIRPIGWLGISTIFAFSAVSARADVVLDWNATLRATMQAAVDKSDPGWSTRSIAMVNGAMYDAFQAVQRTHEPFLVDLNNPAASRDAAAAQAAHDILLSTYPNQSALAEAALVNSLATIPDSPAKTQGLMLGGQIAQQYITWRANDGANESVQYNPLPQAGHWEPDPMHPAQEAWGPEWGAVDPFALTSSTQFSVPGVPSMDSQAYVDAFQQVKELGAIDSVTRTADQTAIALFWAYDRPGMGPPPVLFVRNMEEIAQAQGNTPEENARMFAAASVAMADAAIAAWDVKFVDDFWRPISAIRRADEDGNPATEADVDWVPLGAPGNDPSDTLDDFTPPFPAYVSGHASMGGAVFESLRRFFGVDEMDYQLTSDEMDPAANTRTYTSLSQAESENALSRIYMGVHWSFDVEHGVMLGNQVAGWVNDNHFQPVPEPSGAVISLASAAGAAFLGLGRRRRLGRSRL